MVPKVYNGRNKTFFFLSYEGFRNRIGQNGSILSVPTPEMYQGDFSKLVGSNGALIPIYDPATTQANPSGSGFVRQPFPNNQIPLSRFSTISKADARPRAAAWPRTAPAWSPARRTTSATTTSSTTAPLTNSHQQGQPQDRSELRLQPPRRVLLQPLELRSASPAPAALPACPSRSGTARSPRYDASDYRVTYDWTISPRLLNHFSIGGNKFIKNAYSPNVGQNWKSKVCIPNAVDCNVNYPEHHFHRIHRLGQHRL